jgi:hypothetical protein
MFVSNGGSMTGNVSTDLDFTGNVSGDIVLHGHLVDLPPPDGDGDGVPDDDDACPGTAADEEVDAAGCSQGEFCGGFPATYKCRDADWMGDEPSTYHPYDCEVSRYRCVAK